MESACVERKPRMIFLFNATFFRAMTLPANVTPVVGFALKEIDAMGADTKNINIIFHPINLRFGVWSSRYH